MLLTLAPAAVRAETCAGLAWDIVHGRWSGFRSPDAFASAADILADVDRSGARLRAYARSRCDRSRLTAVLDCTQTDDGLPKGSAIRRTGKTAGTEADLRRLFDSCWGHS